MAALTRGLIFCREVLLVQIDRHCRFADCNARILPGLTKQEARNYVGFECLHCQRWNDDRLTESDVPEWWAEIKASS